MRAEVAQAVADFVDLGILRTVAGIGEGEGMLCQVVDNIDAKNQARGQRVAACHICEFIYCVWIWFPMFRGQTPFA